MTADIRTAARTEAFNNHYSHKQVRDRYDADLLITGFQEGAVWAAARVTPTREQIEDALTERADQSDETGTTIKLDDARDAILALMLGLAEGEDNQSHV